jgi:hypothetical protein
VTGENQGTQSGAAFGQVSARFRGPSAGPTLALGHRGKGGKSGGTVRVAPELAAGQTGLQHFQDGQADALITKRPKVMGSSSTVAELVLGSPRIRRSTTVFVHGFVHETRRDTPGRGRRPETPTTTSELTSRSPPRPETARDARDVRRTAHNPEVAGFKSCPRYQARGPFRSWKEPFACYL